MRQLLTGIILLLVPLLDLQAQDNTLKAAASIVPESTHHFLSKYEGTWTVEVNEWSAPDAEPEKYTLTAVFNMTLSNHFLQWSQTGVAPGGPLEEWASLGYDDRSGQFALVWLSSAGPQTETVEGPWIEAGRSILLTPACSQATGHQRALTFTDKDNLLLEQYTQGKEGPYKSREYHYSRQ
ncbi:DUF1579 family protein [Taibaiella koreensis]|uniref:DUF1579 family protein n=1 Tax=Taibaiella koreensis TaxID=1268548 RepID=UPI000E59AAD6|nr:DUF1579 family protein [Taibaiella koreensis]